LGSLHPRHPDICYPINYGYIEGILAPDGEEQDAYILGIDCPAKESTGQIIAISHRQNDVEDKWVVAPEGMTFTKDQILAATYVQEQYFDISVIV
jgi:inorganic pyrophosphatase